jgi:hypothetical protein
MFILIQIWALMNSINNRGNDYNWGSKLVGTIFLLAECNTILMDWSTPFTMTTVDISGNIQSIHPEAMLAESGSLRFLALRLHRKQEEILKPSAIQ